MLDFGILKKQIDQMVVDRKDVENDYLGRIDLARSEIARWDADEWQTLANRIASSRTSWLIARPSGPLTDTFPRPDRPPKITVIAADGSQIFPDRHEVASCYLINIGYVVIHYGTGERPVLASRPELFYRDEDLYSEWAGRRTQVSREMVGSRRSEMELAEVAKLGEEAAAEGRTAVGLSDGTLILWSLEGKPVDFRKRALAGHLQSLDRLREARVPVAGYISDPGSADVVNALRVGLCPERPPNCDRCSWKERQWAALQIPDSEPVIVPCEPISGVTDDIVFSRRLGSGERSPVFESSSKILEDYGPHKVHFFYVNTGAEIARIEIPKWVVDDSELLDRVHATAVDQSEKGQGYPVVLSESHERAVVRGAEREIFYRFIKDTFVKNELPAEISLKSLKKMAAGV